MSTACSEFASWKMHCWPSLSVPNGLIQTLEQAVTRTRAALQQNGYTQHPQLEGSPALMGRPFLAQPSKVLSAVAGGRSARK